MFALTSTANSANSTNSTRPTTQHKAARVMPGFTITLGFTLAYLSLIVLIPLSAVFLKTFTMTWEAFVHTVIASYQLSFGAAFVAAIVNVLFGGVVAWVLVRCEFPGKKLIDALLDLPFALPTSVAGITLASLYAPMGWFGRWFESMGIKIAFTPGGIVIALIFIGLPFVVRTVQPVLEEMNSEWEEAAVSLGASSWQSFIRVTFPTMLPALITGFALAFARATGEYGSVIFIAGNMPMISEITPLIMITKLEQFDYAGATAIAVVMLSISFAMLLAINALQAWSRHDKGAE